MFDHMPGRIGLKSYPPTENKNPIYVLQSAYSRAINVGSIRKTGTRQTFVPGRLLFGVKRSQCTHEATRQSLQSAPLQKIIRKYKPSDISTVTVLRETLACRIGDALAEVGISEYYGDAFIGATHIKDNGPIRTAYLYENIEGLTPTGLWIIAESFCTGRNLFATMTSLLKKFKPAEILFIAPIASRRAINYIDSVIAPYKIRTTYFTWGAVFGVDAKTLYDMPWGHPDTEPLDTRDQDFFIKMYSEKLCMGGDFGNDYYSPHKALELYHEQLKAFKIKPHIPSVADVLKMYKPGEILITSA